MSGLYLALMLGLASTSVDKGEVTFRPGPQEPSVPERFRLEPAVFSLRTGTGDGDARGIRSRSCVFRRRSRRPTPRTTWFTPSILLRSGFGPKRPGGDCLAYPGSGFSAVALHGGPAGRSGRGGPFCEASLLRRAPAAGEGQDAKRFLSADIERSVTAMRQGVCDVRRAAVWLAARPDVDPSGSGVTGISLGGIVSSLAAAVDPAIREGAFLLAGGDLATILWEMPEGAAYRKQWIESGRTRARSEGTDRPVRSSDLRRPA